MKYSKYIKPISFLTANAAQVIKDAVRDRRSMIITQNGEAKVVVQDVRVYEEQQESLALLKILAISSKHSEDGKTRPADEAFAAIRKKLNNEKSA